ncbi:phosphoenolpyruvate carboxykinase (GTP) [Candidatus Woesearchaeota archaeon]|nr:phosphoenolpyruvate carboxykinase (GTP) [Candidatus Woesearchaeota archaeon]
MEGLFMTIDSENMKKLEALNNPKAISIVNEWVEICKPAKVTVLTDSKEDQEYIRNAAVEKNEEAKLSTEGHTIHYDGYYDQGRDKAHTKILLPKGKTISKYINSADKEECTAEFKELMQGIMEGKEMYVKFYCLGPLNSRFSLSAMQITDSAYVIHSEDILYRSGYEQFKRLDGSEDFFYFIHSSGELDENNTSKNVEKRRIYTDLEENRVFSCNTQYAGNTVGLKKLALRLAIRKANSEDWLTEHMFIMGIHPEGKSRVSYFTGAFPSACGKTSTAMVPGQSIVGDDIAYLKVWDDGSCHAVNIEQGIFGIIADVNPTDDALIYECLTTPRELIFGNVLVNDDKPYWINMGMDTPKEGKNHSGIWKEGNVDKDGKAIDLAHKNSRYTMRINELANADPKADDPEGVMVDGILYGGRDSDTNVPVKQALSWAHGVVLGACLESETTAATIGKEGVLTHSPMANLDFLAVPLGEYIKNHLEFGNRLAKVPTIFHTNYFLKENGKYLNDKTDKKVWLLWAEGRVHGDYEAIETPVGHIPLYEDLKALFSQVFDKDYTEEDYNKQFSIRVDNLIAKIDRMESIYSDEDTPEVFNKQLEEQRERLLEAKEKYGKSIILPSDFQ